MTSQNTPHLASAPGVFERIESLGSRGRRRAAVLSALSALFLHAGGAGAAASGLYDINDFAAQIRSAIDARLSITIDVDQAPPEPEPEPEEEQPEPEPEPEPEQPQPEPQVDRTPAEEAPVEEAPPAAAEAGKVLTAEPDPQEPLDLTGDGFISGTGTRFAGGVTAKDGTSDKAVRSRSATGAGKEGSQGKTKGAVGPPPVDKSRPAGLPAFNWNSCGFPAEAEAEQINQAVVRLVVVVSATGVPTSVNVLSDPGYGFGRIAQRCAMRAKYPVGLDQNGQPIARATKPFLVHFIR